MNVPALRNKHEHQSLHKSPFQLLINLPSTPNIYYVLKAGNLITMKLLIVLLLACIALASATPFDSIDAISEEFDQDWDDWKTEHGKKGDQKAYSVNQSNSRSMYHA